jgi:hypothetical protein
MHCSNMSSAFNCLAQILAAYANACSHITSALNYLAHILAKHLNAWIKDKQPSQFLKCIIMHC